MAFTTRVDRRQFQFASLSGLLSIVFTSLNLGCRRETATGTSHTPDNDSIATKNPLALTPQTQGGKRYDDPRVKKAHDDARLLVSRLRRLGFGAERERHIFKLIRISERAWAGLLHAIENAGEEIEQAESFCRRLGL